ncbi:MAG TPA: hypothetical protein VMS21_12290 [Methylomirabilota bacterium]|nr:hypothetical protein [Methylomirabilota bacterium]
MRRWSEATSPLFERVGRGTFVADSPPQVTKSQRRKILGQRADALLAEARQLGADFDEVLDLLRARHERMNPVTP